MLDDLKQQLPAYLAAARGAPHFDRSSLGRRLHRGDPSVVAQQRHVVQGVGAGGTHRLRHFAQFGVLRARLFDAEEPVRRATVAFPFRLHPGFYNAQLCWLVARWAR